MELALSLGSDHVTILGGTGTRLDHVLGNIQSLYLALEKGVDCEILDEHNRIRLIQGEYRIKKAEQYGKYVSLIPFTTDVNGVTLEGLKYPVQDQHFTVQGSSGFCVSNEIAADEARISLKPVSYTHLILRQAGIYDVRIEHVSGNLTDHYDPKARVLRLSDSVYGSNSVAAIGVAAHECGHEMCIRDRFMLLDQVY